MSLAADIALAEAATGGRLVDVPTFGDQLAAAGKRLAVVHTGSAGSAYLINPRAKPNGHWTFSILGREHTQTPDAVDEVVDRFGPLPPRNLPRFEEIDYATAVMIDHVLGSSRRPEVALIWFSEPDTSYHYKFIGAPETLAVLKHVDAAFGRILDWIDAQPDADRITVIAASDHGQISTSEEVDIIGRLCGQGYLTRRLTERPLEGAALSVTGGNMGEIRVLDGDSTRRDAVAAWLIEQPFLGMLFSRARNEVEGEAPGSFASSLVGLDHARQADLVYVLRSSDAPDAFDYPGQCILAGEVPLGGGMHGGLNRHELTTVLIVQAGSSSEGRVDAGVAGIIDIGPTILDLLGVPRAPTMAGRSLATAPSGHEGTSDCQTGLGNFRQRVSIMGPEGRRMVHSGGRA